MGIDVATLADGLKSLERERYKIKIEPSWEEKKIWVESMIRRYKRCRSINIDLIPYFTYSAYREEQKMREICYGSREMSLIIQKDVERTIEIIRKGKERGSELQALVLEDHGINNMSFSELEKEHGRTESALKKSWKKAVRWFFAILYDDYADIESWENAAISQDRYLYLEINGGGVTNRPLNVI